MFSYDKTAIMWACSEWDKTWPIRRFDGGIHGHSKAITDIEISGDMKWFVTTSQDTTAKLWNIQSGNVEHTFEGHVDEVVDVAISKDSNFIVTASQFGGKAIIWDTLNKKYVRDLMSCNRSSLFHVEPPTFVAISHKDNTIISGHVDGACKSWFFEREISHARDLSKNMNLPDSILNCVLKNELALIKSDPVTIIHDPESLDLETQMGNDDIMIAGANGLNKGGVFRYSTSIYQVESYFIPVDCIAGIDSQFLETIVECARKTQDFRVFDDEALNCLIMFKWNNMIKFYYLLDMSLAVAKFITFLYFVYNFEDLIISIKSSTDEKNSRIAGAVISSAISGVTALYFIYKEIVEMCIKASTKYYTIDNEPIYKTAFVRWYLSFLGVKARDIKGKSRGSKILRLYEYVLHVYKYLHPLVSLVSRLLGKYFTDLWNLIQLSSNCLTVAVLIVYANDWYNEDLPEDSTDAVSSIILPLTAFEIIYFLSGLERTGPLIRMVTKILQGISGVMVILLLMLLAFGGGFAVLFRGSGVYGFENYRDSVVSTFGFLFMGYELDIFDSSKDFRVARALVITFIFYVELTLLNLLIAIMSHIYEQTQANARSEALYGRAKLILEYEQTFSESYKQRKKKFFYPKWLFILKILDSPNKEDDDEDDPGMDTVTG